MSDKAEGQEPAAQARRLADVIREVKNAAADRDDVVVELREASRTRLELMAAELALLFAQVPADIDLFDFTIFVGVAAAPLDRRGQPRAPWRATAATYRFVKDTRAGRVVLAEDMAIKPVADQVARYVAERMIERERLDGRRRPSLLSPGSRSARPTRRRRSYSAAAGRLFLSGLGLVAARRAGRPHRLSTMALWDRLITSFILALVDPPAEMAGLRHGPPDPSGSNSGGRRVQARQIVLDNSPTGRVGPERPRRIQPHRPRLRFAGYFEQVPFAAAGWGPPIAWPPAAAPSDPHGGLLPLPPIQ